MPTDERLIATPQRTVTAICALLEYGLARNHEEARTVHAQLEHLRKDFPHSPALPLSLALLGQLRQVLLVLCILAGEEDGPGERVTRFSRMADTVRELAI
ncbi:hypothetical protein [Streptomyces sp. NPDC050264]|uniref:hypothetical protein n=1 Tax=Streptomyces sp. NPDC050264 TaxID=3155038 RepID=UPI00343C20B7